MSLVRIYRSETASGRDHKLIDESSFDPKLHKLYPVQPGDEEAEVPATAETKAAPTPGPETEPEPEPKAETPPVVRDEITHEIAKNGMWSVYRNGEKIKGGRGKAALDRYLASL